MVPIYFRRFVEDLLNRARYRSRVAPASIAIPSVNQLPPLSPTIFTSMSPERKISNDAVPEEELEDDHHNADIKSDGDDGGDDSAAAAEGKKRKRKRGPKAKAAQVVNNLLSKKDPKMPQELVDTVMQAVNADGGVVRDEDVGMVLASPGVASSSKTTAVGEKKPVSEEEVRKALEILKAVDLLQGKTGIGGKNKKDMGEFKASQVIERFGRV